MKTILKTEKYTEWFDSLRDIKGRARIDARLRHVELGHFGDCEPVGEGVSELRIHFGPGYRVYFIRKGLEIVLLLGGGDKSSQQKDIKAAIKLAREIRENDDEQD